MKTNWKTDTLGDSCEMYQPKTISVKEMIKDGAYPVYGANGVIGRYNQFNHEEPQLLITCRGATCGAVNISEPRSWITGNAMVLRPKSNSIDIRFLEYLFRGGIDISKAITGAAQPQITRTNLAPLKYSYPDSIEEQQRIVSILDEAFTAIATAKENAEKNLQNTRDIFKSYLQSVFDNPSDDWEKKNLGEIAQHSLGKMLDKAKNRGTYKKYLRNLNVRWFEFDLSDMLEMRFRDEEEEQYTAIKGDVLICEGGYPGRAAIWNEDYPIHFQKAIHRVRFYTPEYNKWFLYFLHLSHLNRDIEKYFTGAGIQHFTGEALDRFMIPLAPISEVKIITQKLDSLFAESKILENIYQRKLNELDELKKSILHKAFNGELSGAN